MRRKLDFYDFLLGTVSILFLTLTVPVLPRVMRFGAERKLAVAVVLLLGSAALWLLFHRPRFLKESPTEHLDLYDVVIALASWFFAGATYSCAIRWSLTGMTVHRSTIISVLGLLTVFSFYCLAQRGGVKKLTGMCLLLAAIALMQGLWKVTQGSISPMYFYASVSKEESYSYLLCGATFLLLGYLCHAAK